jgi:hypothetical protein
VGGKTRVKIKLPPKIIAKLPSLFIYNCGLQQRPAEEQMQG